MGDHPLDALLHDWPASDDHMDDLLWGGDVCASLAALERVRGLVLGPSTPGADEGPHGEAGAVGPIHNAEANIHASARSDEEDGMKEAWSSSSSGEEHAQSATGGGGSAEKGATPLLSSRWLNWDNPGAATKLSAGLPEDTAELRRLKTRDAMRRSRQRQREQLQSLRVAVQDLEAHYSRLCLVTDRDLAVSTRSADLADALALSKRLGAENLLLQTSIQRQELWRQQLNVVMESRAINSADGGGRPPRPSSASADRSSSSAGSAPVESLPFRPDVLDPLEAKSVFGFRPLTQEDVKDVILANTRTVKRVQRQLLLGEGEHSAGGQPPVATMDVFGWAVRQRVHGSHMEFVFAKRFPAGSVSVSEVMHKSWVGEMHLKGMQMLKYDTKRLEVLQQVSPNAFVLGREVLSPDSTPMFRSTLVRYRMESPPEPFVDDGSQGRDRMEGGGLVASGFVIGTYSINPDSAEASQAALPSASSYARELAGDVLWADLTYTIEFRAVADARSGEERFVEIRWAGSTNYKSPFHAYRNTADKISQLLHWELQHIAPVAQIIPTSP